MSVLSRVTRFWTDLSLRGKGLVVVAIPLIALEIGAGSFIVVAHEQHDANQWVEHSLLVRNAAGRVLRYQTDSAASVRGYLLTGNTDYLAPAQHSEQDSAETLTQLLTLVRDNPAQLARARHIDALAQQNTAYLATLQSATPGPTDSPPSFDPQALESDQATLNGLRDEVNALLADEDQLLARRTSRADEIGTLGTILSVLDLFIGLAGGIFAVVLFTTGIVRRVKRVEGQTARLEAGEPLLPLSASADELGRFERSMANTAATLREHHLALETVNQRLQDELAQRGRADETIARLHRRNELILNAAGDGIVGTDRDGRTIFVNPAAATTRLSPAGADRRTVAITGCGLGRA